MRCLDTAPGVEPGCAGLRPPALPLGHAVVMVPGEGSPPTGCLAPAASCCRARCRLHRKRSGSRVQTAGLEATLAPRAGALPSAPRLAVVVLLVGSDGFEPPASSSRTRRAAKLRYDPLAGRLSPTVRDGALDRSRSGGWVPTEGLEPPRPCGHTVLNRARLPVPPGRHEPAGGVARRVDGRSSAGMAPAACLLALCSSQGAS
jgi:hypothetical protein